MAKRIVIGVGGASGSIYTRMMFERLLTIRDQWEAVGVVMSKNALVNWELESGPFDIGAYPFTFYAKDDFKAPFASGSARYDTMIICPCSVGLVSRIAQGISDDLITRAADVILKERRRLIVIPRETPYNLIHLRNMVQLTEAGGIVLPACPSFYGAPATIQEVVMTIVDRALDLAGFELTTFRWGDKQEPAN